VKKKMPGGSTRMSYDKRKPKVSLCSKCGVDLKGIPRLRPFMARNAPKSEKRPERPYGGFLCSSCLRLKLKEEARSIN